MESVAKDVMGCFDPQDQASTITLCKYFVDTYGNLDEPEEWELDSDDNDYFSARKLMNGLFRSVVRRDAGSLTRAVNYVYDFERFSGVYEPGQYCWVRTADSDDIVFKFRNAGGVVCVATAKGFGRRIVRHRRRLYRTPAQECQSHSDRGAPLPILTPRYSAISTNRPIRLQPRSMRRRPTSLYRRI